MKEEFHLLRHLTFFFIYAVLFCAVWKFAERGELSLARSLEVSVINQQLLRKIEM